MKKIISKKEKMFMVCTLLLGMVEGNHLNFSIIFLMIGVGSLKWVC
jgi:hypothetical protein